jgi:hypothetical protein
MVVPRATGDDQRVAAASSSQRNFRMAADRRTQASGRHDQRQPVGLDGVERGGPSAGNDLYPRVHRFHEADDLASSSTTGSSRVGSVGAAGIGGMVGERGWSLGRVAT